MTEQGEVMTDEKIAEQVVDTVFSTGVKPEDVIGKQLVVKGY